MRKPWGASRMRRYLAIAGSLAQLPRNGGLSWFHLQFLLGFRRLGWDVLFLDRLAPEMCFDDAGEPAAFERSLNLSYFLRVMRGFDLTDCFSLSYNRGERVVGLSWDE